MFDVRRRTLRIYRIGKMAGNESVRFRASIEDRTVADENGRMMKRTPATVRVHGGLFRIGGGAADEQERPVAAKRGVQSEEES